MANTDAPRGLKLHNSNGASYVTGGVNAYYVPSSYATALFIGDPVVKTGTANTTGVNDFQAGTLPEVNKSAFGDTNPITGVVVGFEADPDTNLSRIYNPASTERVVYVADDPNALFEIQDDGSAALAATDVGFNANIVDGTGSTVTGLSGVELDATTPAATATFQLKILRLIPRVDNELGVNAKWLVRINNHTEAHATAGV